jgi:hypothetical protein
LREIHRHKREDSCGRKIVLGTSFEFKAIAADEQDADQVAAFRAGIMELLGVTVAVQTDTEFPSWNVSLSREPGRDDLPGRGNLPASHGWPLARDENPSI